jgi:hypothetical protein
MANKEQLEILNKGVRAWNEWRIRNNPVIDLSGASLPGIDLSSLDVFTHIDLHHANLADANLTKVDLGGANLVHADLTGTDLQGASLSGADLFGACLDGVNLTWTLLYGTDLSEADVNGADFGDSIMRDTIFRGVDLSNAKGLELARHEGPSSIDIDTIYLSGGKIPDLFLWRAGVPEAFITYMRSLVVNPIEYYSCFISYSSKDEEFAKKLYRDLQGEQVRCWFAPEDMKIGDEIRPRIDEAIRIHDKLLIVLSENSVGSPWVRKEVETAFGKEIKFETEQKQRRTVLFPIRLDDAVMKTDEAWAADIRRMRHIGDFREWKKHDKYKEAFARLMRDLKAGEGGKTRN